jgi:hypothetical protein
MLLLFCLPGAVGLFLVLPRFARRRRSSHLIEKAANQGTVAASRQRPTRPRLQMHWTNTAEGLRAKWHRTTEPSN